MLPALLNTITDNIIQIGNNMTLATVFPAMAIVDGLSKINLLTLALDAALETHANEVRAVAYADPSIEGYDGLDDAAWGSGEELHHAMQAYHCEKRKIEGYMV